MVRIIAALALVAVWTDVVLAGDGTAIYEKKCKLCHSVGGASGVMAKLGGPLDGVGAKRDEAWLKAYLKDPKSKIPDAKMPKIGLSDEELNAAVEFLMSLKTPAATK